MLDEQFVSHLKRGEKKAIRAWYTQYAPKLHTFFSLKVRSPKDADELTHDTFLSCLKSLPLYRGDASFYGWMLSIARHELADYYRKFYAKRVISALPLGEQLVEAATHETSDMQHVVRGVLRLLPDAVGELLALKYVDKLSVCTIAKKMRVSSHVVQSRLYRARLAFRKLYEEVNTDHAEI